MLRVVAIGILLAALVQAGCAAPATGSSAPVAVSRPATTAAPDAASATPMTSTRPAPTPTPPASLTAVGIGDSVMAGTHCGCAGPMAAYAQLLSRSTGRHVTARGFGVNGATTTSVLAQIAGQPLRTALEHADIVVVIVGANDLNPDAARQASASCGPSCYQPDVTAMGTRLGHLLDRLAAVDKASPHLVLVTDYWDLFPEAGLARTGPESARLEWQEAITAAANTAIRAQALRHGDIPVDTVVPFRGSTGQDDPSPLLATDGDHPNAAGVQVLARALVAVHPGAP